jgi:hypothetical protein
LICGACYGKDKRIFLMSQQDGSTWNRGFWVL